MLLIHKIKLEGDFMYKDIAWNNFCKTGNIESFLEYKKLMQIDESSLIEIEDKGLILDELDKGKRNSY